MAKMQWKPSAIKAAVCNFNRPFWPEISLRIGHFQFLSANGQWPTPIWNTGHVVIGSSARDAEIFLNKQVKFKDLKNYASPNNKVCSNISWFMPVGMKLCQSKQADLLFSASVHLSVHYSVPITNKVQYLKFRWGQKKCEFTSTCWKKLGSVDRHFYPCATRCYGDIVTLLWFRACVCLVPSVRVWTLWTQ